MQRLGLSTLADASYARRIALDFDALERIAQVPLDGTTRHKIKIVCRYFHYQAQGPARKDLYTQLRALSLRSSRSWQGKRSRNDFFDALYRQSAAVNLCLVENRVDPDTIVQRIESGRLSLQTVTRFLRQLTRQYGKSSRGRQANFEFANLVGNVRSLLLAAGVGKGLLSRQANGQRTGILVDIICELLRQLKPVSAPSWSEVLPKRVAGRASPYERRVLGRAIDTALTLLRKVRS